VFLLSMSGVKHGSVWRRGTLEQLPPPPKVTERASTSTTILQHEEATRYAKITPIVPIIDYDEPPIVVKMVVRRALQDETASGRQVTILDKFRLFGAGGGI
jgi:hypothetical protein